jgi:hypothetical protein
MTSLPYVPSMTSSLSVPTIVASDLASVELLVAMVSAVGKRFTVITSTIPSNSSTASKATIALEVVFVFSHERFTLLNGVNFFLLSYSVVMFHYGATF